MNCIFQVGTSLHLADLSKPLDISIPMNDQSVRAWYVQPLTIEPVRMDGFVGEVRCGGSVNFRNILFNPHAHGTHIECMGHITPQIHSVSKQVRQFMHLAELITVTPQWAAGDRIIEAHQIPDKLMLPEVNALIIRTQPNLDSKLKMNYSNTNPPFIDEKAMQKIVSLGIKHLLIDLPSVDRESDEGALRAHRVFWGLPDKPRADCSITEMVYIPDVVMDGIYLLNLSFPAFDNDASPARAVLFELRPQDG